MHITLEGEMNVLKNLLQRVAVGFALCKAPFTDPQEHLARYIDMVEADFPGYARVNTTFGGSTIGSTVHGQCSKSVSFVAGALMMPQTIYYAVIIYDDGFGAPKLIGAHKFPVPRTFTATGDRIDLDITAFCDGFDPTLTGPLP